jgi:hypothetical protein
MPNSKYLLNSNVIPFKSRSQLLASQSNLKKGAPQKTPGTTSSTEHMSPYFLTHSQGGNQTTREGVYETAPSTVHRILQCLSSECTQDRRLPAHLNRRVQLLCDHKHPAGQVLKDWLDGNKRFLPNGSEAAYEYLPCPEETKR